MSPQTVLLFIRSRRIAIVPALLLCGLLTAAVLNAVAGRPVAGPTTRPDDLQLLAAAGRQLSLVASRLTPSVVKLRCRRKQARGGEVEETGSGVIIRHESPAGDIVVTNAHVVAATPLAQIQVFLSDGRVVSPRRMWIDSASDVAVLKLDPTGLAAARWGDSDALGIGHFVLAVGSPFDLSQSVSLGIISAKGRRSLKLGRGDVINQDFLQTDAAINPGNSGGPLVDIHGRVIGINTAIASPSGGFAGVGFSIPSRLAERIVTELLTHGRVRRAYLGVVLDPDFTAAEARALRLPRLRGARILQVSPGTPAARARLQPDDVVLSLGKTTVIDYDHLINLVSLEPIGSTISLTAWRKGSRVTLQVVLTDRQLLDRRG